MSHELLVNPALPRALVIGAFGGVGLVLTVVYSRRGPMIFVPYAALLSALALLLSRYSELAYAARFAAAMSAFATATIPLYVAVGVLAERQRERLRREGRLPSQPSTARFGFWGHVWRIAFLFVVGSIASAGVAFVAC
jgi:hypothetical protein